jgi:hypothetical protein
LIYFWIKKSSKQKRTLKNATEPNVHTGN